VTVSLSTFAALPSALLIDLDGTLVDSVYAHVATWSRILNSEEVPVPCWRLHGLAGQELAAARGELAQWARVPVEGATLRRIIGRYAEEFGRLLPHISPCPGARDLAETAASHSIPVAIVTSAHEAEARALLRIVPDYADHVLITGEMAAAKPDPAPVVAAARAVGADPARCWMIGDTTADIAAAVTAGATALGVLTGGCPATSLRAAGASLVLDDLRGVTGLLARLAEAPTAPQEAATPLEQGRLLRGFPREAN
jgi:HAD superfamily hydrolase (TIGR01549 family)